MLSSRSITAALKPVVLARTVKSAAAAAVPQAASCRAFSILSPLRPSLGVSARSATSTTSTVTTTTSTTTSALDSTTTTSTGAILDLLPKPSTHPSLA
ncbi:hypothetical protein V494_03970, partial [Pseudogymnoascus sp. VKM F-4513 (FW-928)]